jgi:hypothetical protein
VKVILPDENSDPTKNVGASDEGALRWAVEHPADFPQVSQIGIYGETVIEHAQLDDLNAEWERRYDEATNRRKQPYVLKVKDFSMGHAIAPDVSSPAACKMRS